MSSRRKSAQPKISSEKKDPPPLDEEARARSLAEIEEAERLSATLEPSAGMDGEMLDDAETSDEEPAQSAPEAGAAVPPAAPEPVISEPVSEPEKKESAPVLDLISNEKPEPKPEGETLVVVRATANKHLLWAHFKDRPQDGLVQLRVRHANYYVQGEEVVAREVGRGLWEAVTHRTAPRYRYRSPVR